MEKSKIKKILTLVTILLVMTVTISIPSAVSKKITNNVTDPQPNTDSVDIKLGDVYIRGNRENPIIVVIPVGSILNLGFSGDKTVNFYVDYDINVTYETNIYLVGVKIILFTREYKLDLFNYWGAYSYFADKGKHYAEPFNYNSGSFVEGECAICGYYFTFPLQQEQVKCAPIKILMYTQKGYTSESENNLPIMNDKQIMYNKLLSMCKILQANNILKKLIHSLIF
jgi:hypothetical protein